MSCFYVELSLENYVEAEAVKNGFIKPEAVHKVKTDTALVDTGAWTLVINEEVAKQLGLEFKEEHISEAAGGKDAKGWLAKPAVRVCWSGRDAIVEAFVLPGEDTIILGALPMEIMDVMVHPRQEKLVPRNTLRMVK
jgi:clan AA aspartic protease